MVIQPFRQPLAHVIYSVFLTPSQCVFYRKFVQVVMATVSPAASPADPADDSAIVAAFLSWAAAAPPEEVFALFAVLNIIATSVVPFPLGVAGSVVAGIMYGPHEWHHERKTKNPRCYSARRRCSLG